MSNISLRINHSISNMSSGKNKMNVNLSRNELLVEKIQLDGNIWKMVIAFSFWNIRL